MAKDEFVEEDPMELVGMVMPGEPGVLEAMAMAFVEEYVLLGWDEPRLMTLFVNPLFMATHRIYRQKGEEYVRALIRETCAKFRTPGAPTTSQGEIELYGLGVPVRTEHGSITLVDNRAQRAPAPGSFGRPVQE